jgi:ankyrin repeat protein
LTPLSVAVQDASFEAIDLLFNHGASVCYGSPLHYAVRREQKDRLRIIQYLLSKGARINDVMGQHHLVTYHHFQAFALGTPLHEAARNGDVEVVDFLLNNNADPTIEDTRGEIPIQIARAKNHASVVRRLEGFSNDTGSRL